MGRESLGTHSKDPTPQMTQFARARAWFVADGTTRIKASVRMYCVCFRGENDSGISH